MKHEKLKEFLNPDAMKRLCRDYVLEHEDLTILSWDYVIEHGRDWDNEDSIDWDSYGYRVCDITDEGKFRLPDYCINCMLITVFGGMAIIKMDFVPDLMLRSFLLVNCVSMEGMNGTKQVRSGVILSF